MSMSKDPSKVAKVAIDGGGGGPQPGKKILDFFVKVPILSPN